MIWNSLLQCQLSAQLKSVYCFTAQAFIQDTIIVDVWLAVTMSTSAGDKPWLHPLFAKTTIRLCPLLVQTILTVMHRRAHMSPAKRAHSTA